VINSNPYKRNYKRHDIFYDCVCDCGIIKSIMYQYLNNGDIVSCGCRMKEAQIENGSKNMLKHGFKRRKSKHPLYQVWCGINTRCYNPNSNSYKRYGGRGIFVCEEWRHDSEQFILWALGSWKIGLEIDRKDNDGPYSPKNCHFITKKQNCRNVHTNRLITINNETKTMVEWCEIYNRYYRTVNARINTNNWDPVRAVLTSTRREFCGSGCRDK